jgi:2-amino-4-hydroxy-6-hydroxymethyldihydropteridine diphosphokinase
MKFFTFLKNIEAQYRRPSYRNGPRELDLDLLFFDDLVLESEHLIIPHPRLQNRTFVVRPLCEHVKE